MGSVEPLLFSNTIKNIKNLIHNQIYWNFSEFIGIYIWR
jgi:hypothetical protein